MHMTPFLVPAAITGVGWLTMIVAVVVALGIATSMKLSPWSVIVIAPVLIIAWYIAWAVLKTVIGVAISLAILLALVYGIWWLVIGPISSEKK